MSMFAWVRDEFGQRYAINVDNISWISSETRTICMAGTDYQGNGILRLRPEDIQRLLAMTGVAENDTD